MVRFWAREGVEMARSVEKDGDTEVKRHTEDVSILEQKLWPDVLCPSPLIVRCLLVAAPSLNGVTARLLGCLQWKLFSFGLVWKVLRLLERRLQRKLLTRVPRQP